MIVHKKLGHFFFRNIYVQTKAFVNVPNILEILYSAEIFYFAAKLKRFFDIKSEIFIWRILEIRLLCKHESHKKVIISFV